MGGLAASEGGRGGARPCGTAVMLANSDWKELEGEYMEAMPGGSMCGGALEIQRKGEDRNALL